MTLEDVRTLWELIGRDDPLWGVISHAEKAQGKWSPDEFFGTGRSDVELALAQARAVGAVPKMGTALDFGCGVGRICQALAPHFDEVIGVDISVSMVELARIYAAEVPNCTFQVSTTSRLPFADNEFDFAFTLTVLQHLPRRIAAGYVAELLRVLKPGGILFMQMPGAYRTVSHSESAWVRKLMTTVPGDVRQTIHELHGTRASWRDLPMHSLPRWLLTSMIEWRGASVVAVVEDTVAGPTWRSFRYFVRK